MKMNEKMKIFEKMDAYETRGIEDFREFSTL